MATLDIDDSTQSLAPSLSLLEIVGDSTQSLAPSFSLPDIVGHSISLAHASISLSPDSISTQSLAPKNTQIDISGVIPDPLGPTVTSQSTLAIMNHPTSTAAKSGTTAASSTSGESHNLPIIVTAPVVFSITLLGLIVIWYFRRGKGSRAVLPPNTEVHGPLAVTQANAMNQLSRRIEPFHISRNEPRSELLSMKMISRSGRLQFKRGHQVGDLFRVTTVSGDNRDRSLTAELVEDNQGSMPVEENINQALAQRNYEALLPSGSGPRMRSSLAEQVEALRERLQIMEDTMTHLDSEHNIPPPQYTPAPNAP